MTSKVTHTRGKSKEYDAEKDIQPLSQTFQPLTPLKSKNPQNAQNVSYQLSPFPIPPKNLDTMLEQNMKFVETPYRQMPAQLNQIMCNQGIGEKVIFQSQSEQPMSSSETQSSGEEEDSNSQEEDSEQPSEDKSSSASEESSSPNAGKRGSNGASEHSKPKRKPRNEKFVPGKKVFCNCKKTKCLKLYCDCFRINQTCVGCNCQGCHNTQEYNQERNHAILALMDRNPDPFGQKIEDDKHLKGCNCKKSNCLKKYCECFQAGLKCGQNCKCEECKNIVLDKQSEEANRMTAKKERKMVEWQKT